MENTIKTLLESYHGKLEQSDFPKGRKKMLLHQINDALHKSGITLFGKKLQFGGVPFFITAQQFRRLSTNLAQFNNCVEKCVELYFKDFHYRHLFDVPENMKHLFHHRHSDSSTMEFMVYDVLLTHTSFRILGLHSEFPASLICALLLHDEIGNFPALREFSKEYPITWFNGIATLIEQLREVHDSLAGPRNEVLAILARPENPYYNEAALLASRCRAAGFEVIIDEPRNFLFDGSTLSCGGKVVDLIIRWGWLHDDDLQLTDDCAIVNARNMNKVRIINPCDSHLAANNNLLALMSDELHASLFTIAELNCIKHHLPWTRVLRECVTTFHGSTIDLVPYIITNKDQFVIKNNMTDMDSQVIIGKDVGEKEWEAALELRMFRSMVVQEYVPPHQLNLYHSACRMDEDCRLIKLKVFLWKGNICGLLGLCGASEPLTISHHTSLMPPLVVTC